MGFPRDYKRDEPGQQEIFIPGVGWFGFYLHREDGWFYRVPLADSWIGPLPSLAVVYQEVNDYIEALNKEFE